VVDHLRAEADGTVIIPEAGLKSGDQAVLVDGALRGLPALVTQVLPGGERVKILMEMMGTLVEINVSIDALEPAA